MNCFLYLNRTSISLLVWFLLCMNTLGKECTNIPSQLSSHTFRYELTTSNNETLKTEMFSHYHLTPTDESAWASLLPRKMLKEEEDEFQWMMMYRQMKNSGVAQNFLNEVSLHDVRLDPNSIHGRAQQTNLEYLLILDVDNLVWSFRKTAGLPTPGNGYGGWEAPTVELRGHFVGHYMSATAQMWASTHNETLKDKMTAVVSALAACQNKMGTGYLSAFPSELFDRFESISPVWAPYYTIHKIMAGLLDQYKYANNTQALKMLTWMVDYFYNRVQNVISKYSIERHWRSLNEETGGMNDVLYRLYSITGDKKHLQLAHLFDKPCFLGVLALQADDIADFHANTHIPIVIGTQMRYEVTGDPIYKDIGTYFMSIVNSSHSYATGGTSVAEFWSNPKRLGSTLQTENEESCTTYNMLKVSRNLFRWNKEVIYADYYERALTNGVIGIQRGTEPGVMIYMLPLGRGVSKGVSYHGWGNKFDSFWCCYGTGVESFSKLGDSIYFEEKGENAGIYIIQYISSSFNWNSANILVQQKVEPVVSWDPRLQVTVTVSSIEKGAAESSTLNFRIPSYSNNAKAVLNGQKLSTPNPGEFLSITRKWSNGDKVTLELPLSLRTERIKDDRPVYASLNAILYGPYLLVGLTSDNDWDIKADPSSPSEWITPVPSSYNSNLISLSQESGNSIFAIKRTNESITVDKFPGSGSISSVHATFRIILDGSKLSNPKDAIGKSVAIEPFDLPGKRLVVQGKEAPFGFLEISTSTDDSRFHLVSGLDGNKGSVSLESELYKGCYLYSNISSTSVKLSCIGSQAVNDEFKEAASFGLREGISSYHPISFVAKGANRNFLLQPLFSLMDEAYTVYFNIQS